MERDLTRLIDLRCVRPDHLTERGSERVFVHRGGWAYCPAGRHVRDHRLIATGGIELRFLEAGRSETRR
jgi:hypothetical protein